jgi:hypothetical protein
MRRASTCLAVVAVAALGAVAVPAVSSAAPCSGAGPCPTVTLFAKAIPIPGFKGTGNCYGCAAALEVKYTIKGTEGPGGVPSPLTKVTFFLPKGSKIHSGGFVTCKPEVLEGPVGPTACPKKSEASKLGSANVAQKIGEETVHETATVQAFFAPGGGLEFYTNAASPISAQLIAATGHYVPASGLYSQEFISEVKLITTLPGAPPVSTESINLKVGSAFKQGKKVISYGTLPKKGQCPHGGFPVKSELTFQTGETVTANYKAPCPTH